MTSIHPGLILDGKYRIVSELGSGAMGAVYAGENVSIHRKVAVKVLHAELAQRGDVVQRFEREAQAAGRIGSEHIVEVLDLGTLDDGGFYLVMEFLAGETLRERIMNRGRIPPRELAPLIQQLLFGLEMAHEARVIHRDLKPDNVFLVDEHAGQRDFVKILDFGVSKFNPLSDEGMTMTKTGAIMGTPFYMSPEQAKGAKDIDARSDLYSVGVMLYEAVTGQVPFEAGTFNELIFKIVLEAPPPPEQFVPDLDHGFARIIRRAMSREPDQRYQTAAAFRDALSTWLHTGRAGDEASVTPPPVLADDQGTTRLLDPIEASTQLLEPSAEMRSLSSVPPPLPVTPEVTASGTTLLSPEEAGLVVEEEQGRVIHQPLAPGAPTPLRSHVTPQKQLLGRNDGHPGVSKGLRGVLIGSAAAVALVVIGIVALAPSGAGDDEIASSPPPAVSDDLPAAAAPIDEPAEEDKLASAREPERDVEESAAGEEPQEPDAQPPSEPPPHRPPPVVAKKPLRTPLRPRPRKPPPPPPPPAEPPPPTVAPPPAGRGIATEL